MRVLICWLPGAARFGVAIPEVRGVGFTAARVEAILIGVEMKSLPARLGFPTAERQPVLAS